MNDNWGNIIMSDVCDGDLNDFEYLAHRLFVLGEEEGFPNITDKNKYREIIAAKKLGHIVHKKISAGGNANEYGSDAFIPEQVRIKSEYGEYKSKAINSNQVRNLLELDRGNGRKFSPLTISGVYNGAYKQSALDRYSKIDHFFVVFHKEICLLIIYVDTDEVMRQLKYTNDNRKPGATTNLNSVKINLADTHLYQIAYRNDEKLDELRNFFENNA